MSGPGALFDLGNTLLEQRDAEAAVIAFRQCLGMVPKHAGVHYNLGNALLQAGKPVEAIDAFVGCLQLAPDFGPGYVNLANTLRQLASLEQAQAMAELAVQYLPDVPEATICLANVLHEQAKYPEAARLYRQVLSVAPRHAGALSNLGNTLCAMGQSAGAFVTEALEMHGRAVAAAPQEPEFHFNRALTLLMAGRFDEGWDEYEWRWRRSQAQPRGFGAAWCGEHVAGRTIFLHAEQGLGDTLQFVRYAPMVAQLGARVVLEVQPSLVSLMRGLPGIAQVLARGDPLPSFDVHCPLLSLPRAFATRLSTIPAECPYLHVDQAAAVAWKARLPNDGLRVGLVWAGSSHNDDAGAHLINRRRSIDVSALTVLGDVAGVHLISLQKDPPGRLPPNLGNAPLIDLMPDVGDFADTAALVTNLDLVISVDTSVAHLAGALGRPVWVMSRYDGCWRWLGGRDDTPWYPGMRIYRQQRPHDWNDVIQRIHADLMVRARAHSG